MSRKNPLPKSFNYAYEGIKEAFKNEPNFRIHLIFSFAVLILGIIVKLSKIEWIILTFTIFFVLILELINTSLEAITDLVSPKIKPRAKVAKDVAAAAVLLSSLLALIIGLFIFIPKLQ